MTLLGVQPYFKTFNKNFFFLTSLEFLVWSQVILSRCMYVLAAISRLAPKSFAWSYRFPPINLNDLKPKFN